MRSLQAKMFVVFALIATLPLLAMSYLALAQTREAILEQAGVDHEATARAAAEVVASDPAADLSPWSRAIAPATLRVIDPTLDDHGEAERWALSMAAGSGHRAFAQEIAAYAKVPGSTSLVLVEAPASDALAPLARVTALIVVLSGVLMGGILLASVLVARHIVAPVRELTEAASALAAGKLSRRIEPRSDDEIGELGRTFNQMADRIAESLEGLRRSETRYRGLVESANDLIFTLQPDGAFAFVSPLAKRVFGPRAGQGSAATQVVHPDDQQAFREAVALVFERGEPALFVPFRLLASNATSRVVLANFTPVFEQEERPVRVLVVARDVTEERRQELYREKSFLMARLVSEERDLEKLAARGLSILTALAGARGGAVLLARGADLREVAASGESVSKETALKAFSDGAVARTETKGSAALALPLIEQNEVLGVLVLVGEARALSEGEATDVLAPLAAQLAVGLRRSLFEARLKEYAAELESRVAARTAELTAKSEEMESFLYSVSHDLKAPLISMQGYAQALEEDYASVLEGDGRNYVERIRKNASLMESLILDILELSRIGRVHEEVERVGLDDVMGEVAARAADRLRETRGQLVVQPHLPHVHGERRRLEQLFANLVDNALKYRHPERPPRVEVRARVEGGEAVVSVSDNGRGVAERYQEQLFKIFQRVPAAGLPDPGGTGMGLAIVKRIAETQGGRVWVESREGEGTTFHVALPLEDAP